MEKTRSPFQQIIDYRIFFALLVLFTRAVFVQSVSDSTTSDVRSTLASKNGNEIGNKITTDVLTTATVPISDSTFTPSTEHSLSSSLPSKQPPVTQVATTHGKKTSALDIATTTVSLSTKEPGPKNTTDASDLHITAQQKIIDTQSDSAIPSRTSATIASTGIVSNATIVVQKAHSTSGTLTASSKITPTSKSLRPRSKGRPEQNTGKGLITTPGQDMHPESTQPPDMSNDHGTSDTLSTGIGETTAVPGTTASPKPRNHSTVLIIVIILFFLLILALVVACLYCRRRRRSGSTSFNTARWAGQAALPDDTGLDKDVEQAPLATGEKETRRATLTTFFGKRQSRVASIAMEEIDGKDREEAQQLIDGNAGRDSSPQGPGEANGKVPEPTQEETPPTQVE